MLRKLSKVEEDARVARRMLSAFSQSTIAIIGESYGGFRAAKLVRRLQQTHGVGLSMAIAISPVLEWSLVDRNDYDVLHSIGFQIQGRPFGEGKVLKVADAYQRDTDWHTQVPALSATKLVQRPAANG
jgi:acetyl esterase/lipase